MLAAATKTKKRRASHPAALPARTSAALAARAATAWRPTPVSTSSKGTPFSMDTRDTYTACFGEDQPMDVETPSQSLKRLLEERAQGQSAIVGQGSGNSKRGRDIVTSPPALEPNAQRLSTSPIVSVPDQSNNHKFWLGFEMMENAAEAQ
ncbi:hypothetical protein M758_UG073400 [Ceratodon purpureus]|nr:hypothetical protein M758_UG073400 [Ceratodon purpureus]